MRFTTVVTAKGQITIPKQVREKIQLKAGVKVDICPTADGFISHLQTPAKTSDFPADH